MDYGKRFMTFYRRQGSRPSPWKRNAKAKWLSEEALQISVKRREAKSKGGKERYSHLNAEFQRIARRDKKAFLKTRYERDTCTPMFITALFIIARTWKQPRCPSAGKLIQKLWTYNHGILLSH